MASHHHSIKVNGLGGEPLQLLQDKLSTKSSDLYIFWVALLKLSKTTTSCTTSVTRRHRKSRG